MRTVIIQSYRTHNVPSWITRCLASVLAWTKSRGYDHWMTDDRVFSLCGQDYLARVGDNKLSITNLCRLELIRRAHGDGFDRAIWIDADVLVFDPDKLDFPPASQLMLAKETWVHWDKPTGWLALNLLNNCVVLGPKGEPDLDFIIRATRHRALHHPVTHNFQVGVELLRALQPILNLPLLTNVGMFSPAIVKALMLGDPAPLALQARAHQSPVYAANICGRELDERLTHAGMDVLERTRGGAINDQLNAA